MDDEREYKPLPNFPSYSEQRMVQISAEFMKLVRGRRSMRHFSPQSVPLRVIEYCIKSAGTAPSGANMQPWHFVVVKDPKIKSEIRRRAEAEEREFYENRAPGDWLEALAPFDTDANKPFLEEAPCLIVIFAQRYHKSVAGKRIKHYYVQESVGIATGILITALHNTGLATLTHTPSPMGFLSEILNRPKNEKPYLILVTGYPDKNAKVPEIKQKAFPEICTFI